MTIGGGGLTLSIFVSLTSWVVLNTPVYLSRPQFPFSKMGLIITILPTSQLQGIKVVKVFLKNQVQNM